MRGTGIVAMDAAKSVRMSLVEGVARAAGAHGGSEAIVSAGEPEIKFSRETPITLKDIHREAAQGMGRVTCFQGENAI
jgi:hypothetical protein